MPTDELTHITIVLDRSGSMAAVRDDAIGGLNSCVEQQQKLPGAATLTLVQFDHEYEVVHRALSLAAVPALTAETFVPRGHTALFDAIGRAVAETAEYVRALPEGARPTKVVVAILTDGRENGSREWDHRRLKALIEERTAAGWSFWFLGANIDVARVGRDIGLKRSNTLNYVSTREGTRGAFSEMSSRITESRGGSGRSGSEPPKVH